MRVFSKLSYSFVLLPMSLVIGCGPGVDNTPPPSAAEMKAETEQLAKEEEAQESEAMQEEAEGVDDQAGDSFEGDDT